jgi:N-acetylglucosaminyl-diphospho-decaprenol L-rhamnosyltransferase
MIGMREIDVAVIIVTFQSAQLTINCLHSIQPERKGHGPRIRAIVIDNASGDFDSIAEAIAHYDWSSWVTLIAAPINGGFAYGNNLGIEHAYSNGAPSYVYLLNPDTEVRSGAIAGLVSFLELNAAAGIAGSSFENLDGTEWPMAFRFPTIWSELCTGVDFGILTRLLSRWVVARTMSMTIQPTDWICGASMMIRPSVLVSIGGFDENYFLYFEETDFCFRAQRAGYSTWYVPESRVMHIAGQSTKVTEHVLRPRRLPGYWFDSRRRFFAVNYGIGWSIAIDVVAIGAQMLGWLKRRLLGRKDRIVPHYLRDLVKYSAIWRHNRDFPPVRSFRPSM